MTDWKDLGPINVSATDVRSYRAIELANGLQALLIHDAKTDKAAASLDVRAGEPISRISNQRRIFSPLLI
jgi:hypothetical protein